MNVGTSGKATAEYVRKRNMEEYYKSLNTQPSKPTAAKKKEPSTVSSTQPQAQAQAQTQATGTGQERVRGWVNGKPKKKNTPNAAVPAPDKPESETWNKIFRVAAIVAVAAVAVTAVVLTAGAAGAAVGMAAGMYLGASAATVATVATTIGASAIAAGITECAISDSIEVFTGNNFVRDSVMGGDQDKYNLLKLGLYAGAYGISYVGSQNQALAPRKSNTANTQTGTSNKGQGGNGDQSTNTYKDGKATDAVSGGTGRAANKLKSDPSAQGAHSTFKRDTNTGEITNYKTWEPNSRNPNGFDPVKGYDGIGRPHTNSITEERLMPHIHDKTVPGGVRVPELWEIPFRRK